MTTEFECLWFPKQPIERLQLPSTLTEIYSDNVYAGVRLVRDGPLTVIDAGANIGLVSHFLRRYLNEPGDRIMAIEPCSYHFEALTRNIHANGWDNVQAFRYALAAEDGEADLYLYPRNLMMHSIVHQHEDNDGIERVRAISLPTFMAENSIDRVDLLKLDVEGAEWRILSSQGFADICSRIDCIVMELHELMPYNAEARPSLITHMIDLGYRAQIIPAQSTIVQFDRP